jgi:hypothetical protein
MNTNTNDFVNDSTFMKAAKFLVLKKLNQKIIPKKE